MIQTQTLAFDEATRMELKRIQALIIEHRNNPERYAALIREHDEIVKRAPTKLYNQAEDA